MTKNILFTLVLALMGLTSFSQRGQQRIAFVDMNYILENIPAYASAQDQLDSKVKSWQQNLDKIQREIETMKTDLSNEKALLTQDLIAEKNEDIVLKEEEFSKLEAQYFSSDGNLFLLRKQLVTPIQDQVYNATQEIAKTRRYDFVFDKSSDLIMLYSAKNYDISELVLRSILRGEKVSKAAANKASRSRSSQATNADSTTGTAEGDADAAKMSDRDLKRQEALKRIEQQKLDRAKKREDQKKALEEKRANTSSKNISEKPDPSTPESTATPTEAPKEEEDPNEVKISDREAKRQEALQRIEQQKLDRAKKREEQKKAIEKKRLERLKQREKVPNEVKENDTDSKKEDSIEEKENE